ncbi:hypothetical protein [Nitrosophilus alvini]|uniref:hypothetical protein n=1 Tax=Nitrosophilus alvini TaxID=2714855 RepID=UPI00190B986A|nr:hypothetical protein [Nitrosophilus alvini]
MKKLLTVALAAAFCISAFASSGSEHEEAKKKGFLATKWCVENGYFADCRLESYLCGYGGCFKEWLPGNPEVDDLVLFVHDEGRYYRLDLANVPKYELLEKAANRNEVTIMGEIDEEAGVIKAHEFKAPPPPKKSFFKGCL